MKFIEIDQGGFRHLANVSSIKLIWENPNGDVSIQFLGDEEGTYYTTNKYTFNNLKEILNT